LSDSTRELVGTGTAEPAATDAAATDRPAAGRGRPHHRHRRVGKHADEGHNLSVVGGLAALSLDALSSVAYGPESMVLVLIAAGAGALKYTLPLTLVIVGMLVLLVLSYSQVIAAHPEGGGAYAVAKLNLGRVWALLAAASLVVDYVLTVAVSLAAGAASLGSVFPSLAHHLLAVCLVELLLLTAINMFGITESARALMLPTAVFIFSILAVLVIGPFQSAPVAKIGTTEPIHATEAVGIVLLLKAFAAGCSAVTGVEAIANGVPAFRKPRIRTAQRTEVSLGVLLGVMLIGLAVLIRAHHVVPRGGVTILAQLSAGAFGTGWMFYVPNLAVTLVLGLAANTSFGGLPVLMITVPLLMWLFSHTERYYADVAAELRLGRTPGISSQARQRRDRPDVDRQHAHRTRAERRAFAGRHRDRRGGGG
jgi:amino acid transporter